MKKLAHRMINFIPFMALMLSITMADAQINFAPSSTEDFTLSVQNMGFTAANKFEFDVYLLDTDPAQPFELASTQLGFLFSSAFYAGGTITVTINNTGSGLIPAQQFTAAPSLVTTVAGYPGQTLLRMAGKVPPGAGNGTIISTVGYGTLLTHFTFTHSLNFPQCVPLYFTFTSSSAIIPLYASRVAEYIGTVNTQLTVTPGSNALVCCEPYQGGGYFNLYSVTGGGTYCEGGNGVAVGLSGSQVGIGYDLIRNGSYVSYLSGTGAALDFGLQTAGTYLIYGTPGCGTLPSAPMNGEAIVVMEPLPVAAGAIAGTTNVIEGTTGVSYSVGGIANATAYVWSYSGTGVTINGSGPAVTLDFGIGFTSGQLSVHGTNDCGPGASSFFDIFFVPEVIPCPSSTWTGLVNSDWFLAGNWNPCIPGTETNVIITGNTPYFPTLTSATSCASITINSGGSFIGAEYLTVGTSTVKRDLVNTRYHYLSSPVENATFGNVFSGSLTTWAKKWNPLTNGWVWQTSLNTFGVGVGSAVTTSTPTMTADFVGQLNKADVTTNSLSNANGGWNLLGNPFQSAIDWDNIIKGAGVSPVVKVWNGTTYLDYSATLQTGSFDGFIPAENGFFVSTAVNNDFVTVPLAARTHGMPSTFYKNTVSDLLRIDANGNDLEDATFIHFNTEATSGYDAQFDGVKLWGEDYCPQVYSITSGQVLSINELPMIGNETVDLGFKCNSDGSYSLTASGLDNFDASTPILLEDTKINTTQDLRSSPLYNFSYVAGENVNRFKLHFKLTTGINGPSDRGISVYSYDHNVIINNTTSLAGEVSVYDLAGRQLIHTNMSSHMMTSIPMQAAIGAYMVKVVTARVSVNRKIFMK